MPLNFTPQPQPNGPDKSKRFRFREGSEVGREFWIEVTERGIRKAHFCDGGRARPISYNDWTKRVEPVEER